MKSFRLQFIDLDSSYTINTAEAPIKGFITVRSTKGTTEAMYFPYGNEKAINSMIGLPTAHWVDIYEAIAFNREFGLYVSAPPGSGVKHPSYYGGVYLTSRGSYDYWQVSDDKDPSFEVCVPLGSEPGSWGSDATPSDLFIERLSENYTKQLPNSGSAVVQSQALLKIKDFPANVFARTNFINLDYWGADGCLVDEGTVTYQLKGNPARGTLHYVDQDDGTQKEQCGIYLLEGSTYTIYLGGNSDETINGQEHVTVSNNTISSKAPWLSLDKLLNFDELRNTKSDPVSLSVDLPGGTGTKDVEIKTGDFFPIMENGTGDVYFEQSAIIKYLKDKLLLGLSSTTIFTDHKKKQLLEADPFSGLEAGLRFQYRVNIKDITFCRIHQKSPNETPTYVTITNIGYDKWKYDQAMAWVDIASIKGSDSGKPDTFTKQVDNKNITTLVMPPKFCSAIMQGNSDGLVMVTLNDGKGDKDFAVYKLDTTISKLKDITHTLLTQRVYINSKIDNNFKVLTDDVTDIHTYSVREVVSAHTGGIGKHKLCKCEESDSAKYQLKRNIDYNTLTISCKEVVIPGEYTSGGEFTGSLSETGTDSFGSNIFWPNVLPEDSVTFMEVVPVATFDEIKSINTKGFFTGTKIVDPIGPAKDVYSNFLKGSRFCTYVNNLNIKEGKLGSAWRDEYYQIIKDGLIEAQSPLYEDALIFMEPTGYEEFKPDLMSLRVKYHDTSTVISPKIITKAQLQNPKTITVSGRSKGVAQYIGEFKKYDTFTGKHYYCQPIGDVGLQLARIMDKKLGGIAPAGTNDSQGLGGCLARPVLSAKWQFPDSALQILDEKGLCAITYDADYGLMIQSQKSTQDPSMVTDWSYLGHSMSFDLCKREIRDKVMTQQLFKRISPYWMEIRTKQIQAILDKRTTGTDPIWAMATVDISGQNTSQTMAQRKFVIKVTCKVYVFSESVLLVYETIGQD